jgi:hypothetical protein
MLPRNQPIQRIIIFVLSISLYLCVCTEESAMRQFNNASVESNVNADQFDRANVVGIVEQREHELHLRYLGHSPIATKGMSRIAMLAGDTRLKPSLPTPTLRGLLPSGRTTGTSLGLRCWQRPSVSRTFANIT